MTATDARPGHHAEAPGSVDLGNVKVGTTSSGTTVQVTNTGNQPLSVTGASAPRTPRRVLGSRCVATVALTPSRPGDSCTITVSVSPTVTGALTGVLSISSNDPASPTAVSLTATGTVPQASVDASVGFATPRNVPQTLPVTLTNTGNAELDVAHVSLDRRRDIHERRTGNCGGCTLHPGESCSAQIKFLPTTCRHVERDAHFHRRRRIGGRQQPASIAPGQRAAA